MVADLSFPNSYTLTLEQLKHFHEILDGFPHEDLNHLRKMNKIFQVIRPHVSELIKFMNDNSWDVNLAKETVADLQKNPASTADQRVLSEKALEQAKADAKTKVDEFKKKSVIVAFPDREAIAYAKSMYAMFVSMAYTKRPDGGVVGVGNESDVRMFSEVADALKIENPK